LESTGRDNFNVLVQCGGINRTWNRITSSDKLWKFCLTRFQLDNPDIVLDGCKGSSKDIYFELLKKKTTRSSQIHQGGVESTENATEEKEAGAG